MGLQIDTGRWAISPSHPWGACDAETLGEQPRQEERGERRREGSTKDGRDLGKQVYGESWYSERIL